MSWKIGALLFLLGWTWIPPIVEAGKLAGELVLTKGVVKIRREGRERFVRVGSGIAADAYEPLYEKDAVQTGPGARATLKLRLKQTEVARLYPNSYLILEAVNGRRTTFGLPIGKAVFSVSRPPPFRTSFEVRTHRLVISAESTRFVVGAEPSAAYVLALEGQVLVTRADARGIKAGRKAGRKPRINAKLAPGQAIVSGAGGAISAVVKVSDGEREDIESEDGLGAFRELDAPLPAGPEANPDESDG